MNQPPAATSEPEPRWQALIALVAVGGLYLAIPDSLSFGPRWVVLTVVGVLIVPVSVARRVGNHRWNEIFSYILLGTVTVFMIMSLGLLLSALPSKKENPRDLLVSAVTLWMTNILVFASWYWRIDAGGPNARDLRQEHTEGAFLFPQMQMDKTTGWRPGFVDYLFLAFNTSTAFSPTDAPVLSRWAKLVMMVQASISFSTVALLAARAVNIL